MGFSPPMFKVVVSYMVYIYINGLANDSLIYVQSDKFPAATRLPQFEANYSMISGPISPSLM